MIRPAKAQSRGENSLSVLDAVAGARNYEGFDALNYDLPGYARGGSFPDAIATAALASATGLGRSAALSLTYAHFTLPAGSMT
jgi:hypothetical protein